jgi:hypothetical protein
MKKFAFLLLMLVFNFSSISSIAQAKEKWNEMEVFHEVMAKTFHPAEEGKFEPIRTRSAEMLEKAKAWKSSSAPAGFNKKAVKKSLNNLVKGAKEINKLVINKAADSVLKEKLTALHDVFHTIMENCEDKEQH